jgi:hypothetical protein
VGETWRAAVTAACVHAVAAWVSLMHLTRGRLDMEEGPNAVIGVLAPWLSARDVLTLQYRPFCGGCLLEGGLAVGIETSVGLSLGTWRFVAVAFGALLSAGLAALAVRAAPPAGRRVAAGVAVALAAVPPTSLAELALWSWGNHVEATALAVLALALALAPRLTAAGAGVVGLLAGLSVWVAFTAVGVAAVAVGAAVARTRTFLAALAVGVGGALGLSPWEVAARYGGRNPFVVLRGDLVLTEPVPLAHKLRQLAWPGTWEALFGTATDTLWFLPGALALAGVVGGGAALVRARGPGTWVVGAILAWAAVYFASPFGLLLPWDLATKVPNNVRYATPLMALAVPVAAAGAGALFASGRARLAAFVAAALVLPGIAGRALSWHGPRDLRALRAPAVFWPFERSVHLVDSGAFPSWTCEEDDLRCRHLRGVVKGAHLGAWDDAPLGAAAGRAARWRKAQPRVGIAELSAWEPGLEPEARAVGWASALLTHGHDLPLPWPDDGPLGLGETIAFTEGYHAVFSGRGAVEAPALPAAQDAAWHRGAGLALATLYGPAWARAPEIAWPESAAVAAHPETAAGAAAVEVGWWAGAGLLEAPVRP